MIKSEKLPAIVFKTAALRNAVPPLVAVLKEQPSSAYLLGGVPALKAALRQTVEADRNFTRSKGEFFEFKGDARRAAEDFSWIHLHKYRHHARPSLPTLAANCLDRLGVPAGNPRYQAAMLVALRAERPQHLGPAYHNIHHYADVVAIGCELMLENNRLARAGDPSAHELTIDEMAETLIALIGHDLGHPGGKNALPGENAPSSFYRLEDMHFALLEPFLRIAGCASPPSTTRMSSCAPPVRTVRSAF